MLDLARLCQQSLPHLCKAPVAPVAAVTTKTKQAVTAVTGNIMPPVAAVATLEIADSQAFTATATGVTAATGDDATIAERAAIMEYDGGLPRWQAEALAQAEGNRRQKP